MKNLKVVSLTAKSKFLLKDSNSKVFELPIEGFQVTSSINLRHYLDDFIDSEIECTLSKNGGAIRYQNVPFLLNLLEKGVLTIVQKELDESKIYNSEQKSKFQDVVPLVDSKLPLDLNSNRKKLLVLFGKSRQLMARIQYFSKELILRSNIDDQLIYYPVKLKRVNILFQCIKEVQFCDFIQKHRKLKITSEKAGYNAATKQFELYVSLDHEIECQILRKGWGTLVPQALFNLSTAERDFYINAQTSAKQNNAGIYLKTSEILGFIYAKHNFVGVVSDIFDGYIYEIVKKGTKQKLKVELAMVRCPIGDQIGAFQCRQFARRQLIAQQVNVYLKKDSGLNITASIIRTADSKDIQTLMIEHGWVFIRQQYIKSILCLRLSQAQKKAKDKIKGLHDKSIGVRRLQDLTPPNNHKQQFYVYRRQQILKQLSYGKQEGVMDGMIDILTYRIWIETKNIMLKVRLQGMIAPNINPLLQEVKKMKEEGRQIYENELKKRTLEVIINNYNKETNCFIGTIFVVNLSAKVKSVQEIIIEHSLAYCDKQNIINIDYLALEKKVRQQKRNIWSQNLLKFEPVNLLQIQSKRFKGKFSWIDDGETVYVQPQSNYKTLDFIFSQLNDKPLRKATKQNLVVGSMLAAPYFDDLYRVQITSIKGKKVKVNFIDWGNKEIIDENNFYALPESLQFIEKQCLKAKLYMVRPSRRQEYLEKIRSQLIDGSEYQFTKEHADKISAYRNKERIREKQHPNKPHIQRPAGSNTREFKEKQDRNLGMERSGGQPSRKR